MTVTTNDVVGGIKIFENFDDEHVQNVIKDSIFQAKTDNISQAKYPEAFDTAVKQYARHLLIVDDFYSYGGVLSATTLGQSQNVVDKTKGDVYKNQYLQTVRNYGFNHNQGSATFE